MKVGTASSELRVAFAGALVLVGAGWVVLHEIPKPSARAPVPPPSEVTSAPPKKEIRRVGPLRVGEELARGFRITRVAPDADSIRVELNAEGSRRIAIGVSSKQKQLERPPPLDFPDLFVWYVGRGEVPSEYPDLARALVELLERAAGSASMSDMLERWRAEAVDGG